METLLAFSEVALKLWGKDPLYFSRLFHKEVSHSLTNDRKRYHVRISNLEGIA